MKVFLKKMAVIVSAVTFLVAISACDLLSGNKKPDDSSSNGTNTVTPDNGGSTTPSGGTSTGGGGEAGGDQTVTTVAVFEDLEGLGIDFIFYSNNTWEYCYALGTQSYTYMSGTYTGNPAQDGEVSLVKTKVLPEDTEEDSGPGELVDCEPETMNMIVTNGIIFVQDDEEEDDENSTPIYYIRKAVEVANYVTLFDDERGNISLLKIIIYDNYTYRMTEDGKIAQLGNYTENAGNDDEISLTMIANYSEDDGLIFIENPVPCTTSIVNGCFSEGIPYARELEAFKAQIPTEGSETMDSFFRFYADNDEDDETNGFFIFSYDMGIEVPFLYGTYTGDPTSTVADNQVEITIKYVYAVLFVSSGTDGEVSPSSDGPSWEVATSTTPVTLTINNNQFTYDIEGETITYTRQ